MAAHCGEWPFTRTWIERWGDATEVAASEWLNAQAQGYNRMLMARCAERASKERRESESDERSTGRGGNGASLHPSMDTRRGFEISDLPSQAYGVDAICYM